MLQFICLMTSFVSPLTKSTCLPKCSGNWTQGLNFEATLLGGTASKGRFKMGGSSCHNSCLACTIHACHRAIQGLGKVTAFRAGGWWTGTFLASLDSCRVSCRLSLSAGRWPGRGGAAATLLLLWRARGLVLPRSSSWQMSTFHELRVVDHPERSEVVLIADKTLVQRQVGSDGVLCSGQGSGWGFGKGWSRQMKWKCVQVLRMCFKDSMTGKKKGKKCWNLYMERRLFEKTSLFMRIHKRKVKCVLIERKAKLKKIEEKC